MVFEGSDIVVFQTCGVHHEAAKDTMKRVFWDEFITFLQTQDVKDFVSSCLRGYELFRSGDAERRQPGRIGYVCSGYCL
jgi:hypothetical protein